MSVRNVINTFWHFFSTDLFKLKTKKMMELKCVIQKYQWGKRGLNSTVAKLCQNCDESFMAQDDEPYAELWMGTHVNGPSVLKSDGTPLSSVITDNPGVLGKRVLERFGTELPFLFKVLSINKALSVQAHPSKEHAKILHKLRPDLYKDPNHKPELAIALTPFEALCGFRPHSEIKQFLKENQHLRELIGQTAVDNFLNSNPENSKETLKACFTQLMNSSQENITKSLQGMLKDFACYDQDQRQLHYASLVERLNSEFPNDVGCFAVYFFNLMHLNPMEAMYLGPNEPHAYLSGDCIECMACSDNVVRAGLTPKFIDKDTLCSMLNYSGEEAKQKIFQPIMEDQYTCIFRPPVVDFAVAKIEVPKGVEEYTLVRRVSASILLFISGTAKIGNVNITPGTILFLPADEIAVITDVSADILSFQAMANICFTCHAEA